MVSLSTVGYGDIFPSMYLSKFVVVIIIMLNITVMSKFISHLIEIIY